VRTWLGVVAGIVVVVAVIAGVSVFILGKSKKWTLTAPQTIAGMSRNTSAIGQSTFNAAVAKFRSDVTRLPNYGSLKSTVSGIYTVGPNEAFGFIGFNGTFNVQVLLKSGVGLKVSNANPGPHGGTAECGSAGPDAICQWSTGTTVGIVIFIPANAAGHESTTAANSLMIKIRDSVEQPAH
jgi:hypothetical protein